jgi:molybdenum cofactor biosynthesis enzyme MoaA
MTTQVAYLPEDNPFQTVFVDITHRCNMHCANCYLPNRAIPDMDINWLCGILGRLPQRTRIRLAGAEPTMRNDLPDIVNRVRRCGHLPLLLTNGLKLADRKYVRVLKEAGLRSVYLSFNGGFDDNVYDIIDEARCGSKKAQALENLCDENMSVALGMILVRGLNEHHPGTVLDYIRNRSQVYRLQLRSVGRFGRFMNTDPFTLEELIRIFAKNSGIEEAWIAAQRQHESFVDFKIGRLKIQLTQWPDLGSLERGRLAPDGTIHPFFEHVIANDGGY